MHTARNHPIKLVKVWYGKKGALAPAIHINPYLWGMYEKNGHFLSLFHLHILLKPQFWAKYETGVEASAALP